MWKKISLVVLATAMLVIGGFSEVLASNDSVDVEEKADLYKLDLMQDVLKVGKNEITYFWKNPDGVEQSLDLIVILDNTGTIKFVKEKNIISGKTLEKIQTSIKQKDKVGEFTTMSTDKNIPYKLNGGMTESQFANYHSYSRHKYEKGGSSTCSRTRYAKDIGVKSLRIYTIRDYDEKYSLKGDGSIATYYNKRYTGQVSQSTSPDYVRTSWHRVVKVDGVEETHHPLCK